MQVSWLDVIIILAGIYTFYGVAFKPIIFWERGRILRTRNLIGDRKTEIMYYLTAVILLGVGLWGIYSQ